MFFLILLGIYKTFVRVVISTVFPLSVGCSILSSLGGVFFFFGKGGLGWWKVKILDVLHLYPFYDRVGPWGRPRGFGSGWGGDGTQGGANSPFRVGDGEVG